MPTDFGLRTLATKGLYRLGGDPPIRAERAEEPLFRYEPDGSVATLLGSFLGTERVIVPTGPVTRSGGDRLERRRRPFGRQTVFTAAADFFFVADNESYEIRVYSSAGQLRTMIRRELDIGDDYILGLRRDALDVEYVQQFELNRSR